MTLDKKLVDEVIKLTKKYFETSNADYFPKLREVEKDLEEQATWQEVILLCDLAKYTQVSGNGTYEDIYNALAAFGIIVKEIENDN